MNDNIKLTVEHGSDIYRLLSSSLKNELTITLAVNGTAITFTAVGATTCLGTWDSQFDLSCLDSFLLHDYCKNNQDLIYRFFSGK